jgi:hypothetical protein
MCRVSSDRGHNTAVRDDANNLLVLKVLPSFD